MVRLLRSRDYRIEEAESGSEALECMESVDPDLVLMDVHMPGLNGIEVLEALRGRGDQRPVIIMSGAGTIDIAVRALQHGALDFIEKPARIERLLVSVENALRFAQLKAEHADLKSELQASSDLVGVGDGIAEVRRMIAKVAPSEGRVLILGENGTGKELAANAIHAGSARTAGPFIKVNCGSIPLELIESELFGHEKGAFTGAVAQRRGKFELAHKGTLFLDEIGDMPMPMQVKLLRVLQEGSFERVGGSRTIEVDVRVIAATHRDLTVMVSRGEFREDLFYRINVVSVTVPPLRARKEDIPAITDALLQRAAKKNGRRSVRIDEAAKALIARHDFPGNVRELGNVIERLLILCEGTRITAEDVARVLPSTTPSTTARAVGAEAGKSTAQHLFSPGVTFRDLSQRAERQIMAEAIASFDGNKSAAARALGMERAHFAKKCRALGLSEARDDSDLDS